MIWQLESLFEQLAGDWAISRTITGAQQGRLEGTATFTPQSDDRLDYHEAGELVLPNGYASEAFRSYVWLLSPDGFSVHFPEQPLRLFQTVNLQREGQLLNGKAHHDCPPDIYQSRYEFRPDSSFFVSHDVSGPRKAYRIETHYRKNPHMG